MRVQANGIFNAHSGFCALKMTVLSSLAVMDSLFLRMYGDHGLVDSLEPKRWREKTTSAAVSGSPFQNLMPLRIWKVHVRPSGLRSKFSATLPMTFPCGSKVSSASYIAQPQRESITIGSIDSWPKSALAYRNVPVGAAAVVAGAVVAAGLAGATVGAAAGAVVGAAAGAAVGAAAAGLAGAVVGAAAAGCVGAGAAAG